MLNLIPYNKNETGLFDFFDRFERSFWGDAPAAFRQMRVDIADKGDQYLLSAELPGMKKEDIQIDIDKDMLTISAKQERRTEEENEGYIRRERTFGSFSRSFDISDIHAEEIRASYQDGVLTLDLPKKTPEQLPSARQIPIQ